MATRTTLRHFEGTDAKRDDVVQQTRPKSLSRKFGYQPWWSFDDARCFSLQVRFDAVDGGSV